MPSNRPAIPAEITREILIESGHRCAVCGISTPLERAHIIPWHKSKEHKAEDLICLCANCHERADKEKWGEKTLREYKQRPWVMRQYDKTDDIPPTAKAHVEIVDNRQNQAALEAYLDRMTELLLEKGLRESQEGDEVRSIARARTLAVLQSLDGGRKGQVVQFLYESSLIDYECRKRPVVELSGADLSGADLHRANLGKTNLHGANLRKANLKGTTLIEADLRNADLDGANLSRASLRGSNLEGARLRSASLIKADLSKANLSGVNLGGATLVRAYLGGADLGGADLSGANLNGAILYEANLCWADLRGADLTSAEVTADQLAQAASLAGATLPDGTKVPDGPATGEHTRLPTARGKAAFVMATLGSFYKSIEGVKMDLSTFGDFLERLRKYDFTFEQTDPRKWKARRFGCESCWVVALPISNDNLTIDLYLMEWDKDTRPVAYEEADGRITIEEEPNIWPGLAFQVIQEGLSELGVLQDGGPTTTQDGESDVGEELGFVNTIIRRIEKLDNNLGGKLDDLKQGQRAIYKRIDPTNQAVLELILEAIRQQRMEQGEIQSVLDAIRRVLKHVQEAGLPVDDPTIKQSLVNIYQAINSGLSLRQQLELSIPVIPFLLEYKVGLDTGVDLGAVWKELVERIQKSPSEYKSKVDYRRERIRRWREAIGTFDFRNESFGGTVWYSELRPHLQESVVKRIEAPRTYIVPAEKRSGFAEKDILLDEISRIEREWDLL